MVREDAVQPRVLPGCRRRLGPGTVTTSPLPHTQDKCKGPLRTVLLELGELGRVGLAAEAASKAWARA